MSSASLNAEHEAKIPHIFEKEGVYHLCVRLPWDNAALIVALHGVSTYADALSSIRLFNFARWPQTQCVPEDSPWIASEESRVTAL